MNVVVIGLGAMGSAAAQHLAEHGCHVRGFDLFSPPHTHGSSHGLTRIFRQAYFEDHRVFRLASNNDEGEVSVTVPDPFMYLAKGW